MRRLIHTTHALFVNEVVLSTYIFIYDSFQEQKDLSLIWKGAQRSPGNRVHIINKSGLRKEPWETPAHLGLEKLQSEKKINIFLKKIEIWLDFIKSIGYTVIWDCILV